MSRIYLAGIKDGQSYNKWAGIKNQLERDGHRVLLPFIIKPGQKLDESEKRLESRIRIETMLKAEKVVTVEDWHKEKMGEIEVNVARNLEIEVLHFTKINTLCTP
jgi:hypothetical protein